MSVIKNTANESIKLHQCSHNQHNQSLDSGLLLNIVFFTLFVRVLMGVRYSICITGSRQTFCCTGNKSTRKIWNREDKTDVDDIQSSESGRAQA